MKNISFKKVKMVVFDVDGTMTDGSIYIGENGEVFKKFNVKDGLGISMLHSAGILTAIITGRKSAIVNKRAQELKMNEVLQGISQKDKALVDLSLRYKIDLDDIVYIGDDFNDLPAIDKAGKSVCPSDAVDLVKSKCDIVLKNCGGNGAIRELAELILNEKGKLDDVLFDLYSLRQ